MKKKYIHPKISVSKVPINYLYNDLNSRGLSDLLINDVYAQSISLYLPYVSSDIRLKKNITDISHASEKINKLHGVLFNWKHDAHPSNKKLGFIAQEVKKVVPEVVKKSRSTGYYTVQYSNLVALLVEGMKEQQVQIKNLEKKVDKLEKSKSL